MNTRPELAALVFDVDGTLADNERDGHRVAFNLAFEEHGLDWYWDEDLYGRLLSVTGGKERIQWYVEDFLDAHQRPVDLARLIVELHQSKTAQYIRLLQDGRIGLRPGVARLINEARAQGLRLAIATTTTIANVEALLANTLGEDANTWFEVVGAGDVVAHKKPAPDIYHHVLSRMQLPASACIALEDSANGLRAALAAGLETVVTINDYTRNESFAGAALVVDQLGEPGRPPAVVFGALGGSDMVDVACLRALHAASHGDG